MRPSSPRWREITPSEFPHERAGLAHLRELLPDRGPFQAWTNFEFRDRHGKWYEVDALVLGERRLHLLELKHYQGLLTGNAYRWRRNGRSEVSPLLLARRKAQRLKSVIVEALHELQPNLDTRHIPYVQHAIFLHAPNGRSGLSSADATDLFGLDGRERTSGLPSIATRVLEPPSSEQRPGLIEQDDLLVQLFERIGFALRREREVGSWRLIGGPIAEGDGWQDWPAEHRLVQRDQARIRFFVSKPGASDAERRARYQLSQREYHLTRRLRHDAVLCPRDLVADDLGVGLVYPRDERFQRLDLWLADNQQQLSLPARMGMVRQLAETVGYAHRHHVVHRSLVPRAVLAHRAEEAIELRLGDWQAAGSDTTSGAPATGGDTATRLLAILDGQEAPDPEHQRDQAYLAPEGRWNSSTDRIRLDVFALGALSYLILTGTAPADNHVELRDRLTSDGGLDLAAHLPEAVPALRQLVLAATRPTVGQRLADIPAFLKQLGAADRELAASAGEVVEDPLETVPGMLLGGRFKLLDRLGSGSTAVGLLVEDQTAGGEQRVLKVALNDGAAARLRGEAEVLASLRAVPSPRLVRLLEPQPVRLGNRIALVLESAGDTTLTEALRERPRLSLDLLERYGTDLLEALVALDKAGVDHRDIKPANLGVRVQPSDRAKHLVLFDFSLSRAGASAVEAGTPPYLDPFLGTPQRPTWDSAAERYAASVTLFEMATGRVPRYSDDGSNPAVVASEALVEPSLFDPSAAEALVAFFRRALRRDARQRFHTAAEMLGVWRAVFSGSETTVPDDADDQADAAQAGTPLAESGLSPRALSALEPFGVAVVGDLAAMDPVRLSRLSGVAEMTRREVRQRAKQWRERFGSGGVAPVPLTEPCPATDPDPAALAELLVRVARTPTRRAHTRVILGLGGRSVDPFASPAELASALGLSGRYQAVRALTALHNAWNGDDSAQGHLDGVFSRARAVLDGLGGLATVDDLVTGLAMELACQPTPADPQAAAPNSASTDSVAPDPRRLVAGLLMLAIDRAQRAEDETASGENGSSSGPGDSAGESPIRVRRRRRGRAPVVGTVPELLEMADELGTRADSLVSRAVAAGEDIVSVTRAATILRPLLPATVPHPDDGRLVRLAARMSTRSAASRRGELHDRNLDAATAVRIALGGLAPSQRLTVRELTERVRARFPDLQPLPGRPRLDRVVVEAGAGLLWDGKAYSVPSRAAETTLASRASIAQVSIGPAGGPATATATGTPQDAQLLDSARSRSFLALGVTGYRLDEAAALLVKRHGARLVDLTSVLLEALRAEAASKHVPWEAVRSADASEPGSRPAMGLSALVKACMPAVEAAVLDAAETAVQGTRPVLLTEAAPLARYGHTDLITRLADLTFRRSQAIWLLLPEDPTGGAMLDGVPLRLGHAGQYARLDEQWLRRPALEGEPA